MTDQAPALMLVFPLAAAVAVVWVGRARLALPLVLLALTGSLAAAVAAMGRVLEAGETRYFLGGWSEPVGIGIELRLDALNGLVLILILAVAWLTAWQSRGRIEEEMPGKAPQYYALYLLFVTGLLGMTATGDAFNLYVLLEVTSLTGYALVAMGRSRRAAMASFQYIILGTIGASLYLLGVGYLYIKTGTLNMGEIQRALAGGGLMDSRAVQVGFIFILAGLWIKMAFFPLHGWLPNAYAYAPSTSSCLMAPLMTKVSVYLMIRMILTVFGASYVFGHLGWSEAVVWLAVAAILAGSILALGQTELRRMLSYLIVAEVGYMVGGAWLGNASGMVGAMFHLLSDALMTLCLFLAASVIVFRTGARRLSDLADLYGRMPWTMWAFTLGALSMIGVPPTCGFFSKYYLIRGGIEAGHWGYVAAVLISSLVNAILFFRIIELAYFGGAIGRKESESKSGSAGAGGHGAHGGHGGHGLVTRTEGPASMVIPLGLTALGLLVLGWFNADVVAMIRRSALILALGGGEG